TAVAERRRHVLGICPRNAIRGNLTQTRIAQGDPHCTRDCHMPTPHHATLAPAERFRQVARLLAPGLLRLRDRPADPLGPDTSAAREKPPESAASRLELCPDTRLSVHTG